LGTRGATGPGTSPYAYRDQPELWARAVATPAASHRGGPGPSAALLGRGGPGTGPPRSLRKSRTLV